MFLIYLDVCCLNRPFDDQTQERIRLEAESVLLVLTRCQSQEWQLLGSEVVDLEISRTPDEDRRYKVKFLASLAESKVTVTDQVIRRALELESKGFKAFDALHIACAEARDADVLLTTDDQFLHRATRYDNILKVGVENPVSWLMEVVTDESQEGKSGTD